MATDGAASPQSRCVLVVGTYERVLVSYELPGGDDEDVHEAAAAQSSLRLLFTDVSHCGSIRAVALSSPGGVVASGGADEVVQLFDLSANVALGALMRHSGTVTHIEFHGTFLFTGSEDGTICIWRGTSGGGWDCLRSLRGHRGRVSHFAVHPTGRMLISVGEDRTLRTWNLLTAKCAYVTNIKAAGELVRWSPCGARYAVVHGRRVDVWDVAAGAASSSVDAGSDVHAIAFVAPAKLLVGCETGVLRVYDVSAAGATVTADCELKLDGSRVRCLSIVAGGGGAACSALVAAATSNGTVALLATDADDGGGKCALRRIAEAKTTLRPICIAAARVGGAAAAEAAASSGADDVATATVKKARNGAANGAAADIVAKKSSGRKSAAPAAVAEKDDEASSADDVETSTAVQSGGTQTAATGDGADRRIEGSAASQRRRRRRRGVNFSEGGENAGEARSPAIECAAEETSRKIAKKKPRLVPQLQSSRSGDAPMASKQRKESKSEMTTAAAAVPKKKKKQKRKHDAPSGDEV